MSTLPTLPLVRRQRVVPPLTRCSTNPCTLTNILPASSRAALSSLASKSVWTYGSMPTRLPAGSSRHSHSLIVGTPASEGETAVALFDADARRPKRARTPGHTHP